MNTAKTSITSDNFPSGNLLFTNSSGCYCAIKSLQVENYDSTSEFTIKLIEVYPTGTWPDMFYCTTGVLLTTRSNLPVTNINIRSTSNLGSQIRACASGQVEIYCNYINVSEPWGRRDGFNTYQENGKM